MAVTVVLTPVMQKAEKCRFYQEIGGCYKEKIIMKNLLPSRSIRFKCIFVHLEKAFMREKNEREIPLALFIRLEYRTHNTIRPMSTAFYSMYTNGAMINKMCLTKD